MVGALLEFHGFLTDFLSCPKVCLFLYDDISKPQGSPIFFLGVCSFRSMGESDVNLLWWLTGGVSLEICTKLDGTWLEKSSRPRVWAWKIWTSHACAFEKILFAFSKSSAPSSLEPLYQHYCRNNLPIFFLRAGITCASISRCKASIQLILNV